MSKLIIAILLSSLFFLTVEVNVIVYFCFISAIWALIFLNCSLSKNIEIFDTIIILFIGNFGSFILTKELQSNGFGEGYLGIVLLFCYLVFFMIISIRSYTIYSGGDAETSGDKAKLMTKRKKDLEFLQYYVNMFDIVGLNGRWGTGKSFVVGKLKEEMMTEYEFIEIDILACNLDELQLTLIKELEEVMYKNRIVSKYSNRLKSFLESKSVMSKLQGMQSFLINNNMSYSETIKGFKEELNKLDKKIIIVYEDIDRISNKDVIKRIFDISEKLSNSRIKIIYQYHEDNLKDIGFTADYIEKYIPFKMNLTEINFFETLNFELGNNFRNSNLVELNDFNFLNEYSLLNRFNVLYEAFGINKDVTVPFKNMSIRKVKNFLNELSKVLERKQYKEYKEVVISFFFVKHFIWSVYECLSIEEGLLDAIRFNYDSKSYTINELLAMYNSGEISKKEVEEIFEVEENQLFYFVLKLFDFNYKGYSQIDAKDSNERLQAILEEPIHQLKNKDSNEKKNRLIWNLLAQGKSEYTDYEYVGNIFIRDVLGGNRADQIKKYNQFRDRLFHNSYELDNQTIFKIGAPGFVELFKAFRIVDATDEQQIELVDIYFSVENIKTFNVELVQTMNYCGLKTRKEYISILDRINKLHIEGNLNSEDCFSQFLKTYIGALSKLGYTDTEFFNHSNDIITNERKKLILLSLKRIIGNLCDLSNKIKLNAVEKELSVIIEFIEKLINIINCEDQITKKKSGFVTSEISSRYINQDEFDRLKGIANDKEIDIKTEIERSFKEGKITVYEIDRLLDGLND